MDTAPCAARTFVGLIERDSLDPSDLFWQLSWLLSDAVICV
jgi:hypothetical protein